MSVRAEERQRYQVDFVKSGKNIEVGDSNNLPLDRTVLKNIDKNSEYVAKYFGGGLTAEVFKLSINNKFYTLKKGRESAIVQNVDGQTSFLNEVQRRYDFEELKKTERESYSGIVNTVYANYLDKVILSEWIEGDEIAKYDEDIFDGIFKNLINMEFAGIFEYDMINGNLLLTKDKKVMMYDFGYTYTFDPLTEHNPDGIECDVFHPAERFETRCFMQHLMDIEENLNLEKALSIYKTEKEIAIKWYKVKLQWLKSHNAKDYIITFNDRLVSFWSEGIKDKNALLKMYRLESFRSFLLDVYDDVHGKTCNSDTLKKIDNVIRTTTESFDFIKQNDGFFWGDETLNKEEIIKKYNQFRVSVLKYQLKDSEGFEKWRTSRIKNILENY